MTFSLRNQLFAWYIGGAILFIGLGWTAFFPLRQSLQTKSVNILESRITIELNARQQQNLSALKNQVDQILNNTQALNQAFFDRTKTLAFLEYVERLAEKENLQLNDPHVTEPARSSPDTPTTYSIEEQPFAFTLIGPTANLMRFLRTLETHEAYLLVTTIELRGNDEKSSSLNIEGIIPWH